MESPFSLKSTFKFALVFLVLQVAGKIATSLLGRLGFYAVTVAGGLVSSASAVASAGSLASQGTISFYEAGIGAVLASLTSTLANLPVVARSSPGNLLLKRLNWAFALVLACATIGGVVGADILPAILARFSLAQD